MKELKKAALVEKANEMGIETEGLTKAKLIEAMEDYIEVEVVVEDPSPELTEDEKLALPPEVDPADAIAADSGKETCTFKKDFVGYIGGKWYRVSKNTPVDLPRSVVGRFKASGMVD